MYTLDFETVDPTLGTSSSAANGRRGGRILGYALKHNDEPTVWHPWTGEAKEALRYAVDSGEAILAHNGIYELCWLQSEDLWSEEHYRKHNTVFLDTSLRAALLDNSESTALAYQARKYGLPDKAEQPLWDALQGVMPTSEFKKVKKVQKHLDKLPLDLVGEYCIQDVELTYALYNLQLPLIEKMGNPPVFEIEEALLPILALMQFRGIPVDTKFLQGLDEEYNTVIKKCLLKVEELTGKPASIGVTNAVRDMVKEELERVGEEVPLTPTGSIQVNKKALEKSMSPALRIYATAIGINKVHRDYVVKFLMHEHNGRVYPSINQLAMERADGSSKGTRTGRFSYSEPTLQSMPKNNAAPITKKVRRAICALPGHQFLTCDISQQEPRWILHYAIVNNCPGVEPIAEQFKTSRKVDTHSWVANRCGISRNIAKFVNNGIPYGASAKRVQDYIGGSYEEAKEFMADYFEAMPHVGGMRKKAISQASRTGRVETWFGRVTLFDSFKIDTYRYQRLTGCSNEQRDSLPAKSYPLAQAKTVYKNYPLARDGVHKALNYMIQGSSGDQLKIILCRLFWELEIVPTLSVHDEGCLQIPDGRMDLVKKAVEIFENSIDLEVPMVSNPSLGPNWHDAKEIDLCVN